jgi:hypothetical protein
MILFYPIFVSFVLPADHLLFILTHKLVSIQKCSFPIESDLGTIARYVLSACPAHRHAVMIALYGLTIISVNESGISKGMRTVEFDRMGEKDDCT